MSFLPESQRLSDKQPIFCPDCGIRCQKFRFGRSHVSKCESCHGMWFGHECFGDFQDQLRKMDLAQLTALLHPRAMETESICACPACNRMLEPFRYAYNSRVILQRCRPCRALWLPLRELAQLVELAKLSQDISPHVTAVLRELEKSEKNRKRDSAFAQKMRRLSAPIW